MPETIVLASDHAGIELKAALKADLVERGFEPLDLGAHDTASVDYPDMADAVAAAMRAGKASRGVLICGTGIGIGIAANRHRHLRAALCHDGTTARLARQHNDANVLVLGARTTGIETARDCLTAFLATSFAGGRHARRVDKLG
jgi:ribose 5-phosphate isomerase B